MIAWAVQRRNELFIFCALASCYTYFLPRWASWNENSRLDLVLAIVDEGTLSIDRYYGNTGDYALIDGRHYSDKAPGAAFLAVPVYAAVRPLLRAQAVQQWLDRLARRAAFAQTLRQGGSGVAADKVYFTIILYLVTCATVALPSAGLGVVLYRHIVRLTGDADGSVLSTLLYALATPAFAFSGVFFSHQIVACLLFCAFHLLASFAARPRAAVPVGLAGTLLGYAVITEYPAALIALAVLAYGLWVLGRWLWRVLLVTSFVAPLVLLMGYDWLIAGTVLPVGYFYSERYMALHEQGLLSLTGPSLAALWGITFGSFRGLFFVAPVLLLAVPGYVLWWRRRVHRWSFAVCLWAAASFIAFNGSSVMWHGGFSVGPRYVLPMLPFMSVALGEFVAWSRTRWHWRLVLMALGAWSWCAVWAETLGGQSFPDWTRNPLFRYSLPHLLEGNVARNAGMVFGLGGLCSLLPLALLLTAITVLWARGRGVRAST